MERVEELAREVMAANADYDIKYKAKVKAENRKAQAERELHEELLKSKLPSVTIELGEPYGTMEFRRSNKTSASVFDKEAAIKFFTENHMLDAYVEGTVRKAPINQLVREWNETGKELPPGVEPRVTKFVTKTKRGE